ncbi:MAG: hypothetical protein Q9191_002900 [Dirinaria sp. TL-2023a]
MAQTFKTGRPNLLQRKSHMKYGDEKESTTFAFPPRTAPKPSISSDRTFSFSSFRTPSFSPFQESEIELNKKAQTVPDPGPAPDGGLTAWLQVLGAFFLNFNTWGLVNTYGVFQSYYAGGSLFTASQSAIAWLGSIQGFLMLTIGVLCGRAIDAGYLRINLAAGIVTMIFGMMMVSICHDYWQFVLAQGVVAGLGSGATFIPSVTVVGTYFSAHRSLAIGIATTGSSVGGIIYPIVLRRLIAEIGFGWAVRVMAFIMLTTLLLSLSVMRSRLPPRKSGPIVDFSAFRDPGYSIFLASVFITYTGLYVPFFYVESYATNIGINEDMAFYMLIMMNAASVLGRILPPFVADSFFSALILLSWIRVNSQEGIIAISVMYGFISGSIQAVVPATVAFLCPDLSKYGTRLGMVLAIGGGFGVLLGAPLAGAILDSQSSADQQEYWGLLVFSGILVFAGAVLQLVVRTLKVGWSLQKA